MEDKQSNTNPNADTNTAAASANAPARPANVVDMKPSAAEQAIEQKAEQIAEQTAAEKPAQAQPKPAAKRPAGKAVPSSASSAPKAQQKNKKAASKPAPKAKKAAQPAARAAQKAAPKTAKQAQSQQTRFFKFNVANPMEDIMTQSNNQFDKLTREAANASRDSFDAFAKSYSIFAKGYESLVRTSLALSQSAAEKQANYAKQAMGCKTVNEFAEFQNKITQSNFDDLLAGVTQITEISAKTLTDSIEPLNNQLSKAMKKMSEAA